MPFNGPNPRRPCLFWADPVPLLLVSGILIQFLDINTTTSVRHTAFLYTMPLGYFVGAGGRVGPELWVALDRRTSSSRLARPRASACCYRTSQQPFLCPVGANGRPIEVRLPFLLATWLILGTITVTDEVRAFFIYQYVVGAERLGAALDLALRPRWEIPKELQEKPGSREILPQQLSRRAVENSKMSRVQAALFQGGCDRIRTIGERHLQIPKSLEEKY